MANVKKYTIRIKAGERISAEELFCRIEKAKRLHPCAEIFVKAPLKNVNK